MTPGSALIAAGAASVVLALAACSTTTSTATAPTTTASKDITTSGSGSTTTTNPLVGTWQTPAIPAATWQTTYRHSGGTPAEAAAFQAQLGSGQGKTDRITIRLSGTDWVEFEQSDNQTPGEGWSGTYTLTGSTVHAASNDGPLVCHIVYALTLSGETLRIRVVSDEPAANRCAPGDLLAQRTIYETAAFRRTG